MSSSCTRFFTRLLIVPLCLQLALPAPALALRQTNAGMEESPVHSQLRESLGHAAGAEEVPSLPSPAEALVALQEATARMTARPLAHSIRRTGAVVRIPDDLPVVVIGDLHGQWKNLDAILKHDDLAEQVRRGQVVLVILGDAVHPEGATREARLAMGPSLVTMQRILELIAASPPGHVLYPLGNHDASLHAPVVDGVNLGEVYERALQVAYGDDYVAVYRQFLRASPLIATGRGFVACHAIDEVAEPWSAYEQLEAVDGTEPVVQQVVRARRGDQSAHAVEHFLQAAGQSSATLITGHQHLQDGGWFLHDPLIPRHLTLYAGRDTGRAHLGYARLDGGRLTLVEIGAAGLEEPAAQPKGSRRTFLTGALAVGVTAAFGLWAVWNRTQQPSITKTDVQRMLEQAIREFGGVPLGEDTARDYLQRYLEYFLNTEDVWSDAGPRAPFMTVFETEKGGRLTTRLYMDRSTVEAFKARFEIPTIRRLFTACLIKEAAHLANLPVAAPRAQETQNRIDRFVRRFEEVHGRDDDPRLQDDARMVVAPLINEERRGFETMFAFMMAAPKPLDKSQPDASPGQSSDAILGTLAHNLLKQVQDAKDSSGGFDRQKYAAILLVMLHNSMLGADPKLAKQERAFHIALRAEARTRPARPLYTFQESTGRWVIDLDNYSSATAPAFLTDPRYEPSESPPTRPAPRTGLEEPLGADTPEIWAQVQQARLVQAWQTVVALYERELLGARLAVLSPEDPEVNTVAEIMDATYGVYARAQDDGIPMDVEDWIRVNQILIERVEARWQTQPTEIPEDEVFNLVREAVQAVMPAKTHGQLDRLIVGMIFPGLPVVERYAQESVATAVERRSPVSVWLNKARTLVTEENVEGAIRGAQMVIHLLRQGPLTTADQETALHVLRWAETQLSEVAQDQSTQQTIRAIADALERRPVGHLDPQVLQAPMEERDELEMAVAWDVTRLVHAMGSRKLGAVAIGLSTTAVVDPSGRALLDFMDRLARDMPALEFTSLIFVVGDGAEAFRAQHPSIHVAVETPEAAAPELARWGVGSLPYLATPEEAAALTGALGRGNTPIRINAIPLNASLDLVLEIVLRNLAEPTAVTEAGVDLRRLAQNLKQLASLGV